MNTQQLQLYLANSLSGLAKACKTNQKTENTDRLVIQILSDSCSDNDVLLGYIDDVAKETCVITMADTSVCDTSMNALFSAHNVQHVQKSRIWNGLRRIAANLTGTTAEDDPVLDFIYRVLVNMDEDKEYSSTMKQMDIVEKIYHSPTA